jgi:hypothetical protein
LLKSLHTFVVLIDLFYLSSLDLLLFIGSDCVERARLHPDSVLLVGRLGETGHGAWRRDGLLVADDGLALYDFAVLGVELPEVLHTDLDMEVTAAGDDVLFGGLVLGDDDERVGLRQLSEAVHQLGEVLGVLALDGHSDDRGDGVLHHSDVVGELVISVHNGGLLLDITIDSDDGAGVAAGDTGDWLLFTAHHEDGLLELYHMVGAFLHNTSSDTSLLFSFLFIFVLLSAFLHKNFRFVAPLLDSDLAGVLALVDGSGEDSAKGPEPGEILGREHLGDEHAELALGIARRDGLSHLVVLGALIQVLDSVLLGRPWGRERIDDHLEDGVRSVDPFLEDDLVQLSAGHDLLSLLVFEVDFRVQSDLIPLTIQRLLDLL